MLLWRHVEANSENADLEVDAVQQQKTTPGAIPVSLGCVIEATFHTVSHYWTIQDLEMLPAWIHAALYQQFRLLLLV